MKGVDGIIDVTGRWTIDLNKTGKSSAHGLQPKCRGHRAM